MTNANSGAWSGWQAPDQFDQKVFKDTFSSDIGTEKTLLVVNRQVVAGVNYQFIYISKPVAPNAPVSLHYAEGTVAPGQTKAEITKDITLSNDLWNDAEKIGLVGGWSKFHPLNGHDQEVFDKALGGLIGVDYTPTEVSSRIVFPIGVLRVYKGTAQVPGNNEPFTFEALVLETQSEVKLLYITKKD